MKLTYGQRESIRYIAGSAGIELSDLELAAIIKEYGPLIEAKRAEVQAASEAHERYVVGLARMVALRQGKASGE